MPHSRIHAFSAALVAFTLAACQAPGSPSGPVPTVTTSPSVVQSPSAPRTDASAAPSAQPTAPTGQAVISGQVFDDQGALLRQAKVQVSSPQRPDLLRTLDTAGGAYVVQVPVGITIALKVTQDGFTPRVRTVHTASNGTDLTAFTLDFGGEKAGKPYALSKTLEIVEVTPANQATGVSTGPLLVKFRLSHPLDRANQTLFEDLIELRFRLAGATKVVNFGALYDNESATMDWSEDGLEGTFRFNAPLVTGGVDATTVTVGFKEDTPQSVWPATAAGARLGGDLAPTTADAAGVKVYQKIAPFFREPDPAAFPPDRPSPALLWGLTHRTTVAFSLGRTDEKPRVAKVTGYKGLDGAQDRLDVEFDRPMRGFPTELIDKEVLKASNYRFVLGKSSSKADIEKFNQMDPAKDGSVTSETLKFSASSTRIVQIPLPNGTLSGYSQLKLYVDPAVRDIAGNAVLTSPQDPTTGLAANVIMGGLN